MTYCMSDIHGEYSRYIAMLEQIQFSDDDTMYIIGDVIDRLPFGIDILKDIKSRPNMVMIRGNHEQMMLDTFSSGLDHDARRAWASNGGRHTYRLMSRGMSPEERDNILQFVRELPDHLDIEVSGRKFHLVHGLPGDNLHDRLWGRPEPPPEEPPIPGTTVIVGHTCTYYLNVLVEGYDEKAPFEIFYAPGLIDIDCGCGNRLPQVRLACLRLEDMKEFYV